MMCVLDKFGRTFEVGDFIVYGGSSSLWIGIVAKITEQKVSVFSGYASSYNFMLDPCQKSRMANYTYGNKLMIITRDSLPQKAIDKLEARLNEYLVKQ
jgi:hypothetical protein